MMQLGPEVARADVLRARQARQDRVEIAKVAGALLQEMEQQRARAAQMEMLRRDQACTAVETMGFEKFRRAWMAREDAKAAFLEEAAASGEVPRE